MRVIGVEIDEDEERGVGVSWDRAEESDDLAAEEGEEAETGRGGDGRGVAEAADEGRVGACPARGTLRAERAGAFQDDDVPGYHIETQRVHTCAEDW